MYSFPLVDGVIAVADIFVVSLSLTVSEAGDKTGTLVKVLVSIDSGLEVPIKIVERYFGLIPLLDFKQNDCKEEGRSNDTSNLVTSLLQLIVKCCRPKVLLFNPRTYYNYTTILELKL